MAYKIDTNHEACGEIVAFAGKVVSLTGKEIKKTIVQKGKEKEITIPVATQDDLKQLHALKVKYIVEYDAKETKAIEGK